MAIKTQNIDVALLLLSDDRVDLDARDAEGLTPKEAALVEGLPGLSRHIETIRDMRKTALDATKKNKRERK